MNRTRTSFRLPHRSARAAGGFTLMELVLVLAILAIAAAAVAPSLAGFGRGRRAEQAAAMFVAGTHWARSQAISDGAVYRINIDAQAGRWWITVDDGDGFVEAGTDVGRAVTLPEGVRMEAEAPVIDGAQVIEFDASGRSDPAAVRFIGPVGSPVEVACDAPMDVFHVVREGRP